MFRKLIAGVIIGSILVAEIPMSVMATEIVVEDFATHATQIEQVDSVEVTLAEECAVEASRTELLYSGTDIVPNDETGIPDKALYAALEEMMRYIGDSELSMSVEYLEKVTVLEVYDNSIKIESLQGLEYCKNLKILVAPNHEISDVSPLAELTSLKILDLQANQIEDVSALSELTSLVELSLGENILKNANGLEKMASLRNLWLNDNQIEDISALSGLTGLEILYLDRNKISDISSLSGMAGLFYISLMENQISDISPLAGLTQLHSLYLTDNQISDISVLQGMVGMEYLYLNGNRISDIRPLSQMNNLWDIRLDNNRISSTVGMPSCSNLNELRLDNNLITDLSGLPVVKNVSSLYLNNNLISDISPLAQFTALTYLDLSGNQIRDISALSGMTALYQLNLSDNKIADISALTHLMNMSTLNFSKNQISDLDALAGLNNLWRLTADNNNISSLESLKSLTQLSGLYLSDNNIVDVSPLSGMTNLTELDLAHNLIVDTTPLNSINFLCQVDLSYNQITDTSGLYLINVNLEGNPSSSTRPTSGPATTDSPEDTHTPVPTYIPSPTATPSPEELLYEEIFNRLDMEIAKKEIIRYITVDVSDFEIKIEEWNELKSDFFDMLGANNTDYFFIYSMMTYSSKQTGCITELDFFAYEEYEVEGYYNWGLIDYQKARLDYEIKQALSMLKEDMTIAEKALVLYNYQILNCKVSMNCSDTDENSGAHASLLKSIGKAYNYADSLKTLLEAAGIEVRCYSEPTKNRIGWVLVRLEDGTWYSLDAYEDDYSFSFDSEHSDGKVAYDYFLQGGDVYWESFDTWNESTPLAKDGGAFWHYSFDALYTCLSYCGSDWYYLDTGDDTSYIVKTAFDGSGEERIAINDKAYYLFSYKDKLYYNTSNKVYKYDPATGGKEVFFDVSGHYPGYVISGFGMKHGCQALLGLYNEETGDTQEIYKSFDVIRVDEIFMSASKIRIWEIGGTESLGTWYIPAYANSFPDLVWSSMDTSIATVDQNGVVTAVSEGTTTVVARTADGTREVACQVQVKTAGMSWVNILYEECIMNHIGDMESLESNTLFGFADNCDRYLIWESSDPSVVSVDFGGILTANAYGTATITVTTSDGVGKDSCKVIVDPKGINVLNLDKAGISFYIAGVTSRLTAITDLEGTVNEDFVWSSSDTAVATVTSDGVVTAVGNGNCVITVKSVEWNRSASCNVTVRLSDDGGSGGSSDEQRELVQAFVERMYTVALGRASDSAGVEYWTNQLVAQTNDGATIAREFLLGEEFTGRGYSDSEYVRILYATFFCRAADEGGESHWCNALNAGATRAQVLAGFVNSDEFFGLCADYGISRGVLRDDGSAVNPGIYRFAERLYSTVLERNGDKEGIEYWTLQIDSKVCSPEDAAIGFFWSDEYLAKDSTEQEYVYTLYGTFMDRKPDTTGLAFWVARLRNGTDRQTALREFVACEEFQNIIASYGL